MAVTGYFGTPGSGKTYEVVSQVILGALRTGRRVVANVAGLHFDEMRAYLLLEEELDEERIGELLLVTNDDVKRNEFWPDAKKSAPECYEARTVKGGDLVILDECWRFFGPGQQVVPDCFAFLREHRHFVNAAGVSCDVVLISQSIQDLDRKVRVTMEKHFYMEKLKRLGLAKKYTVDVFNGYRMNRKPLTRLIRTYNRKFYPFYSSYAGKGGDEREVDKRINVLRNPWLIGAMCIAPVLFIWGVYGTYKIFSRGSFAANPRPAAAGSGTGAAAPGNAGLGNGGSAAPPPGGVAPVAGDPGGGAWRVVGVYTIGGRAPVFVLESGGRTRFVYGDKDAQFTKYNWMIYVDGKLVTSYSGGAASGAGGLLGKSGN